MAKTAYYYARQQQCYIIAIRIIIYIYAHIIIIALQPLHMKMLAVLLL